MSENKIILPESGYVLAKTEDSAGTKESLSTSNAVYCEEFTFQYTADTIARRPRVPARQGSMNRSGKARVEWTATTEMAMPDAFASASKVPHPDVWLKSAGFARQDVSDAAFEAAFYVLQHSNHSAISFEAYSFTADGADANEVQGRGARSDFEIVINPDDGRFMLNLSGGRALEAATPANTYTANAAQSRAVSYYADKPFLAHSLHAEIVKLGAPSVVFGGGTLNNPSNALQVVSVSISGGMSPTEQTGLAAGSGVARQRLAPTDPVTMTLSIEEALTSATGAFDPYALRDDEDALELRLKATQNDITGNTNQFTINAYFQVVGVSRVANADRALYDLTCELRYPEDSDDGNPAVGVSPTQVFKQGSTGNNGLFVDAALTLDGVLCIGFIKS